MRDEQTIAAYDRQISDYVRLTETQAADPILTAFMDRLSDKACVLDLGCGPGLDSAELEKRGFLVDAVDASKAMVEMAREKFGVAARHATFDDIEGDSAYDAVWANFSLLHAPKTEFPLHLSRIQQALKADGLFHLGMKLGTGERRDKLGRHYAYYGETELLDCLGAAGFRTIEIEKGEAEGLAGDVEPYITILSQS